MRVLVLDTIHGGAELAAALRACGHAVDEVDVYRGESGVSVDDAMVRTYDRAFAPVHLDPDHPLLRRHGPARSHHEGVRQVLGRRVPRPMIEITGARGKTTTAHALAHLMPGSGILHTSTGTYRYPERRLLWRKSITPASVIPAAREAHAGGGWLIAEESLGVSGAGDVAVLTSPDDYAIAAGRKRAIEEKCRSLARAAAVVVPPGAGLDGGNVVHADEAVACSGTRCRYDWNGVRGSFANPLLKLAGYRTPLSLAAATACVLGVDPAPLGDFSALPGRMAVSYDGGVLIVDNANSGTSAETAVAAAEYARLLSGSDTITLVIGEHARTVCEGFARGEIERAIAAIRPHRVVYVGETRPDDGRPFARTLDEGLRIARSIARDGSIVLAVKIWR